MIFIYALVDPVTKQIRYVGQTNDIERRYQQHINLVEDTHKGLWIQSLRNSGYVPSLVVLECVEDAAKSNYREKWWIVMGQQQGWKLTNSANPYSRELSFGDMFAAYIRQEYETFLHETNPLFLISRKQLHSFLSSLYSIAVLALAVLAGFVCGLYEYWVNSSYIMAFLVGATVGGAGLITGAELTEPKGRRLTVIILATIYIVFDLHFVIAGLLRMMSHG